MGRGSSFYALVDAFELTSENRPRGRSPRDGVMVIHHGDVRDRYYLSIRGIPVSDRRIRLIVRFREYDILVTRLIKQRAA